MSPVVPSSVPTGRAGGWRVNRSARVAGARRCCGRATGKVQDERRAGLARVDDAQLPAVGTHELARDGQAEPGALLLGGEERREDRVPLGRWHAGTLVDDAELHAVGDGTGANENLGN